MKDNNINVCILGAGGVGKTAVTLQYVRSEFVEQYTPTIEDEFMKNVSIDGETYTMELIDTAGQEEFKDLRARNILECNAFIMIYAVDDEHSFNFLQEIYEDIMRIKRAQKPPILILGNKCDIPGYHVINIHMARQKCELLYPGVEVIEGSARLNKNIDIAFEKIVRMLLHKDEPLKDNQPKKKDKRQNEDQDVGCTCRIF